LEALGGVGFELDSKSKKSLRKRGFGIGFGQHGLRFGFEHDRFVDDDVSLGDIPLDQEWNQGSHPDRFERTDSGMCVRVSGQLARRELVGRIGVRAKTQIWIAMATYLLVAILHKELKLPGSLHRTLQILSVHPFEKIALHELLMKNAFRNPEAGKLNQMELFDL
jgi:hypothetical protein